MVVTSVLKKMKYAGLIYYKEKGVEDLVTFTAAKDLNALVQVSVYCYECQWIHFCTYSTLNGNIHKLN